MSKFAFLTTWVNKDRLNKISSDQIKQYLTHKGWSYLDTFRQGRLETWIKPMADNTVATVHIYIPSTKDGFKNWDEQVMLVLESLSEFEQRGTLAILMDIEYV